MPLLNKALEEKDKTNFVSYFIDDFEQFNNQNEQAKLNNQGWSQCIQKAELIDNLIQNFFSKIINTKIIHSSRAVTSGSNANKVTNYSAENNSSCILANKKENKTNDFSKGKQENKCLSNNEKNENRENNISYKCLKNNNNNNKINLSPESLKERFDLNIKGSQKQLIHNQIENMNYIFHSR